MTKCFDKVESVADETVSLVEVSRPRFRLRVGEVRVFYDVSGGVVEILAIVAK